MPLYRAYIDKKIVTDDKGVSTGGEHSRVFDAQASDEPAFLTMLKLKKDEALNQIVSLYEPGQPAAEQVDAITAAIAQELGEKLGLEGPEALELAKGAAAKAGLG